MQEDSKEHKIAGKTPVAAEEQSGFVPAVGRILSEYPDLFIPAASPGETAADNPTRFGISCRRRGTYAGESDAGLGAAAGLIRQYALALCVKGACNESS
ncbi:MAG: hypothetical protein LBJ20_05195 [Candidatus Methanoplasma sp.]|jgi:hypothetical protein|nr:hypothetical protein [Candidatus Methanoplasma sp.]